MAIGESRKIIGGYVNIIRKAKITDAYEIRDIVNGYAKDSWMLPLSLNKIYDNLRDFSVCAVDGRVVAVGALHIVWSDIAEIRSIATHEDYHNNGYAMLIVSSLVEEAKKIGIKELFLLTYRDKFFSKFGFKEVDKQVLPHKVWGDCINCPKFPDCDEIAMMKGVDNV